MQDNSITQEIAPTEYWIDQITPDTEFAGGTGTQTDPYQISSALELALLAKRTNEKIPDELNGGYYGENKYYVQTQDIDLANYQWTPIGNTYNNYISGFFDGQKNTIKNIYINTTENYQGLFGYSYCKINNVIMEGGSVTGGECTGALVGYAKHPIENCSTNVIVTGTTQSRVGGVCGYLEANATMLTNFGSVSNNGGQVGGIVGFYGKSAKCSLSFCQNYGDVTGKYDVGGIAGACYYSVDFLSCVSSGIVSLTENGTNEIGGIVGWYVSGTSSTSKIIGCRVQGAVMAHGESKAVGAIVGCPGTTGPTIEACSFEGTTNFENLEICAPYAYSASNIVPPIITACFLVVNGEKKCTDVENVDWSEYWGFAGELNGGMPMQKGLFWIASASTATAQDFKDYFSQENGWQVV